MYCPFCGKPAFPVRIACLKCNATLPSVPRSFEPGEWKSLVAEAVACLKCGSVDNDARICCEHCDATIPRPFSLVYHTTPEEEDAPEPTKYYLIAGKNACWECRKLDGKTVSPKDVNLIRPPVKTCMNPVCWCSLLAVTVSPEPQTSGVQTGNSFNPLEILETSEDEQSWKDAIRMEGLIYAKNLLDSTEYADKIGGTEEKAKGWKGKGGARPPTRKH